LQGVLPIDRSRVSLDVVAGVTLAALAIPEVMGYTKIAGMPVVTGLYTILIPIALFAIFGSSRHLVVGADSATAAILAAGLAGLAAAESSEYVALAGLLAIVTGGMLILARLLRLGFLADFLSRTVLIGFLTGVGIQVAAGQISGMLGVAGGGSGTVGKLITDVQQLGEINWPTLALSLVVIFLITTKRISGKIPGALIAVVGSIILSYLVPLPNYGITLLGPVPGGLPAIGLPDVSWSYVPALLATAFSCFLVILAQSAATSRAYAARYSERFSENVDLVGLALANLGAGLSGTFVVNGSPTKTQMADSAGGRSQVAQLSTSVITLVVLLFLTVPLSYLPNAVLATVVFMIGVELVDVKGMRRVFAQARGEFYVALITAATVVLVGVEQAILLAIVLSLIEHVRRGYRPKNGVVVPDATGGWRTAPLDQAAHAVPGLLIYRFNHGLYYANAERFSEEILELSKIEPSPVSWICIDAAAIADVDFSAGATLQQVYNELKERNIRLVFVELTDDVRAQFDTYGITDLTGTEVFYATLRELVDAYRRTASAAPG
jgi:high affinity sulfate transporter 1